MASKYGHIIGRLPRHMPTEAPYREKVEEVKRDLLRQENERQRMWRCPKCRYALAVSLTVAGSTYMCPNNACNVPGGSSEDAIWLVKDAEITFLPAPRLAGDFRRLRDEKDDLEKALSALELQLEATKQLMVVQYEVEGVTSLSLDDGATVRVQKEPYAQVKDKEAFRLWCIANGLERSLMLPWQTTNSICKERLLAGEPEPTGVEAQALDKVVLKR